MPGGFSIRLQDALGSEAGIHALRFQKLRIRSPAPASASPSASSETTSNPRKRADPDPSRLRTPSSPERRLEIHDARLQAGNQPEREANEGEEAKRDRENAVSIDTEHQAGTHRPDRSPINPRRAA